MKTSIAELTREVRFFFSWSMLDQLLVSSGNFLTIAICAHRLSLVEQGKLSYVFVFYFALLLISIAAIFQGASVLAPSINLKDRKTYYVALIFLQLTTTFACVFLTFIAMVAMPEVTGWDSSWIEVSLTISFLFFQSMADFNRRGGYIFKNHKVAFYSSLITYVPRLALLFLLSPGQVSSVLEILLLTSVPAAVWLFISMLCSVIQGGSKGIVALLTKHLSFSGMLILGAPLGWLWSNIPIFFLGSILGKEGVAVLVSIRSLTNFGNVALEQIEIVLAAKLPVILKKEAKEADLKVIRLLLLGSIVWCLAAIALLIWGQVIIELVLGGKYKFYTEVLYVSWLAVLAYMASRFLSIRNRSKGNVKVEFYGAIWSVSGALGLSYPMIVTWGLMGAALVFVLIPIFNIIGQFIIMRALNKRP